MQKIFIRSFVIGGWIAFITTCLYLQTPFASRGNKTINVFAWGDILEPSIVSQFEKETGIKVRMSYYASNEELIVKMKATKGKGYDLIIPSDYAVKILIQDQLLHPINKEKLNFWNEINPNLLGHHFDPQNTYSIPLEWEVFGFGIDKEFFSDRPLDRSWKLIFDEKQIDYRIAMTNDPIEAMLFASFYLFHDTKPLSALEIENVKELLIQQKQWVEAYANFRGDYFLSTRNCPVVVASSSYIWKTMRQFPFVSFITPKEGSFICIENLAIPARTEKQEYTYQFINYLFQHESVKTHFETFGFFPSTLQALTDIDIDPRARELIESSSEAFNQFHFIEEIVPQQILHDTWVEIKTSNPSS
ncbi:MAG: extracellular solute-binding protein [Chlamydiae bacterium]|nr:extracellular solute-binding protein [Chlamydiota bacterium]